MGGCLSTSQTAAGEGNDAMVGTRGKSGAFAVGDGQVKSGISEGLEAGDGLVASSEVAVVQGMRMSVSGGGSDSDDRKMNEGEMGTCVTEQQEHEMNNYNDRQGGGASHSGRNDSGMNDLPQSLFAVPPGKTADEEERVRLLRALNILDTEEEERFNSITKLVSSVFKCPIAAISLVDEERQWFKAAEGLGSVRETSRDDSFCGHVIVQNGGSMMIVNDALLDARFSANPLVIGEPGIRFYAGAPLISSVNGIKYGSLCVIDTKPHPAVGSQELTILSQFADLAVREIEKDKLELLQKIVQDNRSFSSPSSANGSGRSSSHVEISSHTWGLQRAVDCFGEGVLLLDMSQSGWNILYGNSPMSQLLGVDLEPMMGKGFWEFFIAGTFERQEAVTSASSGDPFSMAITFQNAYHPEPEMFSIDFRPASNSALSQMPLSGIPAYALSGRSSASSDVDTSNVKNECRYYFAITRPQNKSLGSDTGSVDSGGSMKLNLSKVFPTVFKDVRLGPLIGRGAYGRVYRGTWNGNIVAVKVITSNDPNLKSHETDTRQEGSGKGHRGIFEAALSAALSHPNVVHTYQYAVRRVKREAMEGEERQILSEVWLIAEFCNRGPLLTAIERGAFLTQPSAQYGQPNLIAVLQTLQEIAAAMQYLHSHDVVHGDLTGGNVLLTSSDKDARGFTAKVVDFGLSRVCSEDGLRTKTMGCAEYM